MLEKFQNTEDEKSQERVKKKSQKKEKHTVKQESQWLLNLYILLDAKK